MMLMHQGPWSGVCPVVQVSIRVGGERGGGGSHRDPDSACLATGLVHCCADIGRTTPARCLPLAGCVAGVLFAFRAQRTMEGTHANICLKVCANIQDTIPAQRRRRIPRSDTTTRLRKPANLTTCLDVHRGGCGCLHWFTCWLAPAVVRSAAIGDRGG